MKYTGRTMGVIAAVVAIGIIGAALVDESSSSEASVGRGERNLDRRFSRTVDGVRFAFRLETWSRGGDDWSGAPIVHNGNEFRMGRLGISKNIVGPQGAEAIIFWTSFPDGERADACASLFGRHVGRSAAALATAVATAPGTKLVEGPSDVTVGGRPAKHVVLNVRKDVGCDPGYFYSWPSVCWGPCWTQTNTGDRVRVWIVGVKGTLLFIEAETTPQATRALKREIRQIVESIRFD